MTPAQRLQAALYADFLPRYRGALAVLLDRARRYAGTRNRELRRVRRIALQRAARRLYRLCDRWGGLGVFPPIDPSAPELWLLQATVEIEAARRDGDPARRRQWRRALARAAVAPGTGVRG